MAPLFLCGLLSASVSGCGSAVANSPHLVNQDPAALKGLTVPFTFAVVGDCRTGREVYGRLAAMIAESSPAFVMNTGDVIASPGSKSQLEEFAELSLPLTMPVFIAAGNHEVDDEESEAVYLDFVRQPGNELYYSFSAGDALFLVLNTEEPGRAGTVAGAQLEWLKGVLSGSGERFKFVFIHRPLYPDKEYGRHYKDSLSRDEEARDSLQALFVRYGVDAVFAGHEHLYLKNSVDGVYHIITGGGGAPLYASEEDGGFHHYIAVTVGNEEAVLRVLDIDGNLRDEFTITRD